MGLGLAKSRVLFLASLEIELLLGLGAGGRSMLIFLFRVFFLVFRFLACFMRLSLRFLYATNNKGEMFLIKFSYTGWIRLIRTRLIRSYHFIRSFQNSCLPHYYHFMFNIYSLQL